MIKFRKETLNSNPFISISHSHFSNFSQQPVASMVAQEITFMSTKVEAAGSTAWALPPPPRLRPLPAPGLCTAENARALPWDVIDLNFGNELYA